MRAAKVAFQLIQRLPLTGLCDDAYLCHIGLAICEDTYRQRAV